MTVTVSLLVSSSSTPRTVTVRGWFQFEVVNTKLVGTDNAPASPEDTATVTAPVGWVAKLSRYVAVVPSSTLNCWGENTKLGGSTSSSTTVTVTVPDTLP